MTISTLPLYVSQTKGSETGFKQVISEGAPSLLKPLIHLVSQYLLSEPKGWITEWTGPRGYDVIYDAITNARTSLKHTEVTLVVQYLKKSDIFGLADLEKAAGKAEELSTFDNLLVALRFRQAPKSTDGKKELTALIGRYDSERPLPLDIDDEMQKDVAQLFYKDKDTLWHWNNLFKKVTDIYSLYWCPRGMSPYITKQLAKKHGQSLLVDDEILQEYGNTPTRVGSWIQFPNDVFGRNKTVQQQEALIPKGFEFPHLQDTLFCVFMKYMCTGERIMSDLPMTYTRCQVPGNAKQFVVGAYSLPRPPYFGGGLHLNLNTRDLDYYGVAIARKFIIFTSGENQDFIDAVHSLFAEPSDEKRRRTSWPLSKSP